MFSSKESPIEGVPVIPGGTWYGGHLHLMKEPDFQVSLRNFSVDHADEKGRCTFFMGPTTPSLSVTHHTDVQALLKASSHREIFPIMKGHLEHFFGKYNIGSITGKEWKTKRAVVVKALHGSGFMEHNKNAIRTATHILADRLEKESSVEDILEVLKMLTLDIFGQAALHEDFGCCKKLEPSEIATTLQFLSTEVMRRMTTDIANPASYFYSLPTTANKRHAEADEYLKSYISGIVEKRRDLLKSSSMTAEEAPQDLLTIMVLDSQGGGELSEDMLTDTIKSLLFAGYETTSVMMTFVLYMLSQNPEIESKCFEEIQSRPDEFVYLDAVIKETMRLYPPVISTTRSLERDMELDDIHIPKGTYLYMPILIIQRLERNFPDPLTFIPERWAKQGENGQWQHRRYGQVDGSDIPCGNSDALVAFSAGARNCAGQRFATQEMTIALSILLERFKFEASEDHVLELHRPGFVQTPKHPMQMKIVKR
jgi:cytochrome P450